MVRLRNMNLVLFLIGVLSVFGSSTSTYTVHDINQDRAECTDQLIVMATCLPYVGGDAMSPTMDCCSGVKQVLSKSLKCMCILVKDRNDPSLGFKVNSSLALTLPQKCHSPVNISKCIDLLMLPVSSPDAKMFLAFEKSLEGRNTTVVVTSNGISAGADTAAVKSDGTRSRTWRAILIVTLASGVIITWKNLLNEFLYP